MGFLDLISKKYNERRNFLLEWQNFIMPDSKERLIMPEHQLKAISQQQAANDLRIINDCTDIISTTVNPETFFMRLNLLLEKSKHLSEFEKYISFTGASPIAAYNEVVANYQKAIKTFLIRYFSDTFDKAEAMKTEKGKIGKYKKFYESLQLYYCYMDNSNIEYIETKYQAYTRNSPERGDVTNKNCIKK